MNIITNYTERTIQELIDITVDLSSTLDIDIVLEKINRTAGKLVSAEACSILLFDDEKKYLYFKVASGKKASILRRVPVTNGVAWWVAHTGKPAIANSSDKRFTGAVDKITKFSTEKILCVPLVLDGEVIGVFEALNKEGKENFTEHDQQLFTMLAGQIAIVIRNASIAGDQRNFFTNMIEILVKAIESVGVILNWMSEGHCWRVAKCSIQIGQKLDIGGKALDDLYYGAALHDVGILTLKPDEITSLNILRMQEKNGYGDIRLHPIAGADMVKEVNLLRGVAPIIRHHHEYFDGTGYPDGLKGEQIPLAARIVALAEVYEEMLMRINEADAIEMLKTVSGTILDPFIVDIFCQRIS